jgi:preprotein translocase subunit SecD
VDVLGGFESSEEAGYLATVLTAGPLPAPLKVIGSRLVPE